MKIVTIIILSLIFWGGLHSQCNPVSDNMTLLDSWKNPFSSRDFSDCWGYVAPDGKEYAIIGDQDSTYIVDVSDPQDIFLAVSIGEGDNSVWRDYKVFGNYLYMIVDQNLAVNDNGIIVYDLSSLPTSVTKTSELNVESLRGHDLYIDVQNERLYSVGIRGAQDICLYDLSSSPQNPTLLACYDLDTIAPGSSDGLYIHDIFVKNNIAYCSHGDSGYYIWDMNNLASVSLLGYLENGNFDVGYVHSSWNSDDDNHAIVATENGIDPKLYWVDQSVPGTITVLSTFKDPLCPDPGNLDHKRPHNPYIIGDKIYTSYYHDGLNVLEIDFDADTIGRVGYYDTFESNTNYNVGFQGNWGAYPYLPSGNILASDISNGLFVLSYNGPSTYTFLGPGTNYEELGNWYNEKKPLINFTGSVIIAHDCETEIGGGTFSTGAKITINSGVTFIQR